MYLEVPILEEYIYITFDSPMLSSGHGAEEFVIFYFLRLVNGLPMVVAQLRDLPRVGFHFYCLSKLQRDNSETNRNFPDRSPESCLASTF